MPIELLPQEYRDALMALTIVLGVVQCFFGYRVFKIILGIVGFIICGSLATGITAYHGADQGAAVLAFIIGGAIGSVLFVALFFVGLFIVGAFVGAGVLAIAVSIAGTTLEPPMLIIAGVIGGVLAIILQKFMIIFSTSFGGADNIVSGIAYFVGSPTSRGRGLDAFMQSHGEHQQAILIGTIVSLLQNSSRRRPVAVATRVSVSEKGASARISERPGV